MQVPLHLHGVIVRHVIRILIASDDPLCQIRKVEAELRSGRHRVAIEIDPVRNLLDDIWYAQDQALSLITMPLLRSYLFLAHSDLFLRRVGFLPADILSE